MPENNEKPGMGDRVFFKYEDELIAGKIVGICPYYDGSLKPPSYYYEIEAENGDMYEIELLPDNNGGL